MILFSSVGRIYRASVFVLILSIRRFEFDGGLHSKNFHKTIWLGYEYKISTKRFGRMLFFFRVHI